MKFIAEEVCLHLPEVGSISHYKHEIESITKINGQVTEQRAGRELQIMIKDRSQEGWEVDCIIKNTSMKLPSVLKKQERLSVEIAKVLNRLSLQMSPQGEIINLLNHQEVLNKWRVTLSILEKEYVGGKAKSYLKGITRKINSPLELIQDLKEYRMLGCLFNKFYQEHSDMNSKRAHRNKKISNLAFDVSVPIKETILLSSHDDKEIILRLAGHYIRKDHIDGKITKALLRKNVYDVALFAVDKYAGVWSFNQNDKFVNNASLEIKTSYGSKYSKTINYKLVRNN